MNSSVSETPPFSNNPRDRTKHPKLRGADVYVARLGSTRSLRECRIAPKKNGANAKGDVSMRDDDPFTAPLRTSDKALTGSLHDELLCKEPRVPRSKEAVDEIRRTIIGRENILDSRPCYRCVLYMHSAGIGRVHWTNSEGQWESAKVRDLFDQVSGTNMCDGQDVNSSSVGGVFVTKHEILMLRRLSSLHTA